MNESRAGVGGATGSEEPSDVSDARNVDQSCPGVDDGSRRTRQADTVIAEASDIDTPVSDKVAAISVISLAARHRQKGITILTRYKGKCLSSKST